MVKQAHTRSRAYTKPIKNAREHTHTHTHTHTHSARARATGIDMGAEKWGGGGGGVLKTSLKARLEL